MLVFPTVEQHQLSYPILTLKIKFQSHRNQSTHFEDTPAITIELRQTTVDQLICFPTIEQYRLNDTILEPTICNKAHQPSIRNQICQSSSSEITSTILIHIGKPN
ncbi:hypothetical protein CEXT_505631 [Caerostris extrusa]|uniref:Uncharacterized protein n=1 Tax=Caerostris extrusa TaxID=172846 RepID=A0AAV4XM36_CAEEX|nr:hypothetical protein CEXT_505631 [Caerostris extrusa]